MTPLTRETPASVKTTLGLWHTLETWVALIAFSVITILLIYDVVLREIAIPVLSFINVDARFLVLYGSQKIAVFMLVWGAFVGIGIATWCGAQLVPTVLFGIVPSSWNARMNRLADVVTAFFLLGVTVVATLFVIGSFQTGQRASGGVPIEVWKVQIAIPLGFASAMLRYFAFAIWPDLRPNNGDSLE